MCNSGYQSGSFLEDDPRSKIVGGLLPMKRWGPRNNHGVMGELLPIKKKIGSAKSPAVVDAILKDE